jgi:hypothetical protein
MGGRSPSGQTSSRPSTGTVGTASKTARKILEKKYTIIRAVDH